MSACQTSCSLRPIFLISEPPTLPSMVLAQQQGSLPGCSETSCPRACERPSCHQPRLCSEQRGRPVGLSARALLRLMLGFHAPRFGSDHNTWL